MSLTTCSVAVSENGWTDDFLCVQWFEKVCIPWVLANSPPGFPPLIIFDGHGSHIQLAMRKKAREAGIILFCLPAHTTHRSQPLDVGVFGPLQRAYTREVDLKTGEWQKIDKYNVIGIYMKARDDAFKEETIRSSFAKTGICPWNPNVFEEEDYAPSYPTSTVAHFPETYPIPENFAVDDDDTGDSDTDTSSLNSEDSKSSSSSLATSIDVEEEPPRSDTPSEELSALPSQAFPASLHPDPTLNDDVATGIQTRHLRQVSRARAEVLPDERLVAPEEKDAEIRRLRAHAALMAKENAKMRQQLNLKNKPRERRELRTEARILTSEEGMRLCEEDEEARRQKEIEKEQKRAEKARKRQEKAAQDAAKKADAAKKKADAAAKKAQQEKEKEERAWARERKRLEREEEAQRKRAEKERRKADKEAEAQRKQEEKERQQAEKEARAKEIKESVTRRKRSNTVSSRDTQPKRSRKASTRQGDIAEKENTAPGPSNSTSQTVKPPRQRPKPRKALTNLPLHVEHPVPPVPPPVPQLPPTDRPTTSEMPLPNAYNPVEVPVD